MFLIKIFKFLKGYVIITLRGFFIERFINICTVRNIGLWDIKKSNPSFAVMKISARDFKRIRQVARKTHTVVRIKQKRGLKFFVSGYKKRYALFIGIMLFVFSCAVLPRFIWTVDIEGCETISRDEMSKVLHEAGIYAGVRKSTLKTPQEIRDIVMNRFDNITWAWIYINGSHAVMKIEERAEIPEITDKTQTGDIIALKDGVISKITVKEGKALVFPGNAVMAGDTLIAGNITTKDGTPRSVHALGEAEAFTYYSESRDVKLYEDIRTPTGKSKSFYTLCAFSKNINLFPNENIPFGEYDTANTVYTVPELFGYTIPLSLSRTKVGEVTVSRVRITEKNAADRARELIEDDISSRLLPQSELVNKNTYVEKIDDETIRVHVRMEFKELIGMYRPASLSPDGENTQTEQIGGIE